MTAPKLMQSRCSSTTRPLHRFTWIAQNFWDVAYFMHVGQDPWPLPWSETGDLLWFLEDCIRGSIPRCMHKTPELPRINQLEKHLLVIKLGLDPYWVSQPLCKRLLENRLRYHSLLCWSGRSTAAKYNLAMIRHYLLNQQLVNATIMVRANLHFSIN